MSELSEGETQHALAVAGLLVDAGVPMFVAGPCGLDCDRKDHKPGEGHNRTGFHLPAKWQTSAPTPDVVNRWRPGWALCAVMGHALDLVDVDPRNGGDASAAGLKAAGVWPRSYARAATPSGGWHDFIAPLGAGSHDAVAAGIDIKGGMPDGTSRGFAFIAPTVRRSKATGTPEPYRWAAPPDLDALAEGGDDSGAALADLVRSAGRSIVKPPSHEGDPFDLPTVGPWEDIAGALAASRHKGVLRLASALRGRGGWRVGDALAFMRVVVWPLIDQAQGGHQYTEGEFEADIRDVFARYPDGGSADERGEAPPIVEWDTPIPVDRIDRTPLPASDGRRPARLWQFVDAQAEALQVPRDMIFMLVLSILSTSTRGRWLARINPDWAETLSMMTVVTMPSASRKSAAVSAVTHPLHELERTWRAEMGPEVARAKALRDIRQAKYDQLRRKLGAPKGAPTEDEVLKAQRDIDEIDIPVVPRLLADDVTPEKLAAIMHEQGGPIGVISDEGTLFGILCGRYSSTPNLELVLKAHVGRPYQVDRIGRDPLRIDDPFLAIGVTIQPGVLEGLGELPQLRDTGLLARFLFALPSSNVGHRNLDPDPMPFALTDMWRRNVSAVLAKSRELDSRRELPLTAAASRVLRALRAQVEPMLDPEFGALGDLGDWAGKLPGALVRIAALLTLFESPGSVEIDAWAMEEAVGLANWLTSEALSAFDMIHGRHARTSHPRIVLAWIKRKRVNDFSVRGLRRDLGGQKWADVETLRDVLDDLEDANWIRRRPAPTTRTPGRPASERYDVNPAALDGAAPVSSVNFVNAIVAPTNDYPVCPECERMDHPSGPCPRAMVWPAPNECRKCGFAVGTNGHWRNCGDVEAA